MRAIIIRLLALCVAILAVVNIVFMVFPSASKNGQNMTFETMLSTLEHAETIDLSWVDSMNLPSKEEIKELYENTEWSTDLLADLRKLIYKGLSESSLWEFTQTYLIEPIKFIMVISTMMLNIIIYIGYFVMIIFS